MTWPVCSFVDFCYGVVRAILSCLLVYTWRSYSMATVSTERGGTARHWCSPMWSYHSGAETASLVACETENWFQIGGAWSCFAVPVGWLSTRHGRGTSTSQVFRHLHVCRPADTVTDWRQEFLSRTGAAMEQPTDRDPGERHYVRILWTITLAVFVRLGCGALWLFT